MKTLSTVALAVVLLCSSAVADTFPEGRPATTNNDDSCDVGVYPAATLLLPYFAVDLDAPVSVARTTVMTIVNTSRQPQIGRLTVWTDLGYPVFTFNVFLTGYDVQALNLYDILVRGVIAPDRGTSNANTPGSRSLGNGANPLFLPDAATTCSSARMPVQLPVNILTDFQNALTTGSYSLCGTSKIGTTHPRSAATGYVTVDVVANCLFASPADPAFYDQVLYDNVLTGDYEEISPNPATGNYAGGNPLVHIRAVPEGGAAGVPIATNLPYTFYSRFAPSGRPNMDRRQPLPSVFSARFIQGGGAAFNTDFRIWREPVSGTTSNCAIYASNAKPFVEVVRFDERENPTVLATPAATIPAAASVASSSSIFPPLTSTDVAGWMYLNLHNSATTPSDGSRPSQNWVTVDMFAEGRYSVMFDATMLSNGCSRAVATSGTTLNPIGPGPNQP
jgi:hypothetical protein